MQALFYHNQSKAQAFHGNLDTKSVRNAITLHPIKQPPYMYRLHSHFFSLKIQNLQYQAVRLQRALRNMDYLIGVNGTLKGTREKISLQVRNVLVQNMATYIVSMYMTGCSKLSSFISINICITSTVCLSATLILMTLFISPDHHSVFLLLSNHVCT